MSFFSGDTKPIVYDYEGQDGRALDEDNDFLNDETFGVDSVGKDFDFGSSSKQGDAHTAPAHPAGDRTGGSRLEPLAELWGQQQQPQQHAQQSGQQQPGRPMTLQELEQQMIHSLHLGYPQMSQGMHQSMPQGPPQGMPQGMVPPGMMPWYGGYSGAQPGQGQFPQFQQPIEQFPGHFPNQVPYGMPGMVPPGMMPGQQITHSHTDVPSDDSVPHAANPASNQPAPAIFEDSKKSESKSQKIQAEVLEKSSSASAQPAPYQLTRKTQQPVTSLKDTHDALIAQSNADREKQQARDRKKSEQSRYNGLMGDWDKNFILKIQLQQLISQDPYNEDFYYQVYTAIRGHENTQQPLSDFSKTYLFRGGQRGRRNREKVDPMQRLQNQIQEAVERVAARNSKLAEKADQPKRTEGSLGQGKNSNAARPRTALLLPETNLEKRKDASSYDVDYVLRALEEAYDAVLTLEAHERARPAPDHPDAAEWASEIPNLQDQLWEALEVQSPLDSNSRQPFIMMLNRDKGKKLISRAFSHLDQRRRLTILTRVFHQINDLDVIKNGVYSSDDTTDLDPKISKSIELFGNTVLQPLQHFIGELDLNVLVSLFDLLMRAPCGILHICQTRIGQAFITIMVSRAETVNQENSADAATLQSWRQTFDHIFVQLQTHLRQLFPPRSVENSYVWHFLASLALAATLDHQRLLVDAVRDRIFGTISEAKSLPEDLGIAKINNLNLFLNVMGLNATFDNIAELSA